MQEKRQRRTYGRLYLQGGEWVLDVDPGTQLRARRIFQRAPVSGIIRLTDTAEICFELEWFMQRFPLDMHPDDRDYLAGESAQYSKEIQEADDCVYGGHTPREYPLAIPARQYQRVAADLLCLRKRLLLGDPMGLGKTVSAIAASTRKELQPVVVVVLSALREQWEQAFATFAPEMNVHVIRKTTPYSLPKYGDGRGPDVVIISYGMVPDWVRSLKKYAKTVVFDEVQELRRAESQKHIAAVELASVCEYRLGLSGTPIYNYGGELWNVFQGIAPDAFGTREEFVKEWCSWNGGHYVVKEPAALGAYLRQQHLFLRREKSEVGRELPEQIRVVQKVNSDAAAFLKEMKTGRAGELAKLIVANAGRQAGELGQREALGQLDTVLRKATGVAKAPYVAAFVEMLLEADERVVLYGWHRDVYSIWLDLLKEHNPAMFTGSESPAMKEKEKKRFCSGETKLLIMSLRSGVGVDGLQHNCNTVVIGELDWSAAVVNQVIDRVHRDGQKEPVTAYFMLSDDGIDPQMSTVLGIKDDQLHGIVHAKSQGVVPQAVDRGALIRQLANKLVQNPTFQKKSGYSTA